MSVTEQTATADSPMSHAQILQALSGQLAAGMSLLGIGLGTTLQNLVLAVQNQVRLQELGAASTSVSFFRSLGGTIGLSALGAVLGAQVARYTAEGLARLGVHPTGPGGEVPKLADLPAPVRAVVENAYGHATGNLFLYTAPFALLALVAVGFIQEVPLRMSNALPADE